MDSGIEDDLPETERRLFREAMRGVRELAQDAPPRGATRRRPPPRARFTALDRRAVLAESLQPAVTPYDPVAETGEELQFRRDGLSTQVFRRLRSGEYRVEAELDLHGFTVPLAGQALGEFLAEARIRRWRVVRVVHGKGLRSGSRGPVLKRLVNAYLQRIDAVLAFASAREVDGGSGACLVLLARR